MLAVQSLRPVVPHDQSSKASPAALQCCRGVCHLGGMDRIEPLLGGRPAKNAGLLCLKPLLGTRRSSKPLATTSEATSLQGHSWQQRGWRRPQAESATPEPNCLAVVPASPSAASSAKRSEVKAGRAEASLPGRSASPSSLVLASNVYLKPVVKDLQSGRPLRQRPRQAGTGLRNQEAGGQEQVEAGRQHGALPNGETSPSASFGHGAKEPPFLDPAASCKGRASPTLPSLRECSGGGSGIHGRGVQQDALGVTVAVAEQGRHSACEDEDILARAVTQGMFEAAMRIHAESRCSSTLGPSLRNSVVTPVGSPSVLADHPDSHGAIARINTEEEEEQPDSRSYEPTPPSAKSRAVLPPCRFASSTPLPDETPSSSQRERRESVTIRKDGSCRSSSTSDVVLPAIPRPSSSSSTHHRLGVMQQPITKSLSIGEMLEEEAHDLRMHDLAEFMEIGIEEQGGSLPSSRSSPVFDDRGAEISRVLPTTASSNEEPLQADAEKQKEANEDEAVQLRQQDREHQDHEEDRPSSKTANCIEDPMEERQERYSTSRRESEEDDLEEWLRLQQQEDWEELAKIQAEQEEETQEREDEEEGKKEEEEELLQEEEEARERETKVEAKEGEDEEQAQKDDKKLDLAEEVQDTEPKQEDSRDSEEEPPAASRIRTNISDHIAADEPQDRLLKADVEEEARRSSNLVSHGGADGVDQDTTTEAGREGHSKLASADIAAAAAAFTGRNEAGEHGLEGEEETALTLQLSATIYLDDECPCSKQEAELSGEAVISTTASAHSATPSRRWSCLEDGSEKASEAWSLGPAAGVVAQPSAREATPQDMREGRTREISGLQLEDLSLTEASLSESIKSCAAPFSALAARRGVGADIQDELDSDTGGGSPSSPFTPSRWVVSEIANSDPKERMFATAAADFVLQGAFNKEVEISDAEVVAAVGACVQDSRPQVRLAAVKALSHVAVAGDKQAIEVVGMSLSDKGALVRRAATRILEHAAEAGCTHAVTAASSHLGHKDSQVRLAAAKVLAKPVESGNSEAIEAVASQLQSPEAEVRAIAVEMLQRAVQCGNPEALPAIWASLKDPDVRVRYLALGALSSALEVGLPVAVDPLSFAAEEPNAYLRRSAEELALRVHKQNAAKASRPKLPVLERAERSQLY